MVSIPSGSFHLLVVAVHLKSARNTLEIQENGSEGGIGSNHDPRSPFDPRAPSLPSLSPKGARGGVDLILLPPPPWGRGWSETPGEGGTKEQIEK